MTGLRPKRSERGPIEICPKAVPSVKIPIVTPMVDRHGFSDLGHGRQEGVDSNRIKRRHAGD